MPTNRLKAPFFGEKTAQFQSFSDRSEAALSPRRAKALRQFLRKQGLDGLLLPRADIFQGEYIPARDNSLAWLTGFTGSAGFAIITEAALALFVDGRYTIQARAEANRKVTTVFPLAEISPEDWLKREASGRTIGYDANLFTERGLRRFERAALEGSISLSALKADPFEALWTDRPPAPSTPVIDHPATFAGQDRAAKIRAVQDKLRSMRAGTMLLSDCPSLNWLLNIRAGDVPFLPILRAFALVPVEGRPTLFVDETRLDPALKIELQPHLDIVHPAAGDLDGANAVEARLVAAAKSGLMIRLDEESAAIRFVKAIREAGGRVDLGPDPLALMKARKNMTELAGARAAHKRDGIAMVRFLAWLDRELAAGTPLTEIDAAIALEEFRRETAALVHISFPSISAAGPNAALPHYRVTHQSNRRITPGLFLIDSGGQYREGTTDITRTVLVRRATREMKDRFTRVLRGMIAVARARFPKGTSGAQLDTLAREPLWQAGLDFDHGTGHGVGSFLSVHEGPQRISKLGTTALEPGMILSDEPGYYRDGAFGIRIENLVAVTERPLPGDERTMLGFETLTFCPIDRRLILKAMLTQDERAWLNSYHAETRTLLATHVTGADLDWLIEATGPL